MSSPAWVKDKGKGENKYIASESVGGKGPVESRSPFRSDWIRDLSPCYEQKFLLPAALQLLLRLRVPRARGNWEHRQHEMRLSDNKIPRGAQDEY